MADLFSIRKTAIIVGALILVAYSVVGVFFVESLLGAVFLELVSGVAVVGMGVLMFPVLRPHGRNLSLGYFVVKVVDGVLIVVAGFLLWSSDAFLLGVRDWIWEISSIFFGTGFLLLSFLFYKSRLVPRFVSVWGLIGSVSLLVSNLLSVVGFGSAVPFFVSHLPVILNELFLALWLIVKGFNPSVIASGSVETEID